jgi:hypothetical protein
VSYFKLVVEFLHTFLQFTKAAVFLVSCLGADVLVSDILIDISSPPLYIGRLSYVTSPRLLSSTIRARFENDGSYCVSFTLIGRVKELITADATFRTTSAGFGLTVSAWHIFCLNKYFCLSL